MYKYKCSLMVYVHTSVMLALFVDGADHCVTPLAVYSWRLRTGCALNQAKSLVG